MIPPTPTPLPPDPVALSQASQIDLGGFRLWDLAPEAIGFWNQFGGATQALQWVVFALIIVIFIFVVMKLLKRLGEGGNSDT